MASRSPGADSEDGDGEEVLEAAQDRERTTAPDRLTESAPGSLEEHRLIQKIRLAVIEGVDTAAQFTSRGERVVIGTHDSADLRLSDKAVSRFHCELRVEGAQVLIRDLGSRNGTTVNGVTVLNAMVPQSAVLTIGRTRLRVDLGPDHVNVPLSERTSFGTMVGHSPAMRACFSVLQLAAESDATVLLEGETGTGKEAAAESLHRESARREGPFIVVDCGAIPPDLLESELFGHERGAFTGAVTARRGAFEAANGGTIFLDEIGELPLDLQPKLLRVLERKEAKRVGATQYQQVNARVIAATNRNLKAEVNAKRFRSDLYYRLAVVEVRLPPLRERLDDLGLLIAAMVGSLNASPEGLERVRSREFMAELMRHDWPGNVRELRNHLERCLALRQTLPIGAGGLGEAGGPSVDVDIRIPLKEARDSCVRAFERAYLEKVLAANNGQVTAAARAAGVDRIHFYRLLWKAGLK